MGLALIVAGPCADTAQAQEPASSVHVTTTGEVSGYTDTDNVSVLSPALGATVRDSSRGWTASGGALADIVTAASVDIVSTATPRWTEVRYAGNVGLSYQPSSWGGSVSGSVSREPDYLSLSGSGAVFTELDDKHITPRLGYAYTRDQAGRKDTPFSVYSLELTRHTLLLSSAFVINRSTELSLLGDAALESGRQEKPYRYLPLFDAGTVGQIEPGASISKVNALRLPGRLGERLPTTRQRYSLSARLGWRGQHNTINTFTRGYADSWGLTAATAEARWLHDWSQGSQDFWVRGRGHLQGSVDFWERAYTGSVSGDNSTVPRLRTGDREHGPLWSTTLGVGYRNWLGKKNTGWRLGLQLDGSLTQFTDTLYIDRRWALFGTVQMEKRF